MTNHPNRSTEYRMISVKGTRVVIGTRADALAAAREMNQELQPAYGVTVERVSDSRTVAEVR
jgi:hypothetical protein